MSCIMSSRRPRRPCRPRNPNAVLIVLAAALLPAACSDHPAATRTIPLPDPDRYRRHGLHRDLLDTHRILLVSRPASGGTMLVALDARCPHDGADIRHNDLTDRLHCTSCDSRWTTDGLIQSGSTATESLDRYRIGLSPRPIDGQRQPYIDTSRRLRQTYTKTVGTRTFQIHEWSSPESMYMFELDPRLRSIDRKIHTRAEQQ